MKKTLYIFLLIFSSNPFFAQKNTDSLVVFSDLKYHSDLEKSALENFVNLKKDTFNLMMAIDENMNDSKAKENYAKFNEIFRELKEKKIDSKNINTKIKKSYQAIHDRFLTKYSDNEFFPTTMETGLYNCVSATILYAMIFDKLSIPYKVLASTNHVYLVANPGSKSIVVETTNPGLENAIFTGEYKQQYLIYLKNSKMISDTEIKNKSTDEIFQEKFKEVKDAKLSNLPGFQYYNKALILLQNNDFENAYPLAQKAYYFFPDPQCKALLKTTLAFQIDKCNFNNLCDIDYLAQLSRFENSDINLINGIFSNIISRQLEYTNKEAFCDSLYNRCISQMNNKEIIEEISFSYNMQMAYHNQFNDKALFYAGNALKIKSNHVNANMIFINNLIRKLNMFENPATLLDSVNFYKTKYNFEQPNELLTNYEIISYLRLSKDAFTKNKLALGEKYISLFEQKCQLPLNDELIKYEVERTYYAYSSYYYRKKNYSMQKNIINKGLKYVPHSDMIKGTGYRIIKM